jgi:ABC-type multidrug transport system fused ATPase/permease subunit
MNNISSIQNTQRQLQRLAAQRELYASAKKWYTAQLIGSIVISVIGSILGIYFSYLTPFIGLYGICFFVIDVVLIERIITEKRTKAAKIQELFDCDVLQLKPSPLKVADDIVVEEVLTYYNAFTKAKKDIDEIKDWHPPGTEELDLEYARLICQRTNSWWDSMVRRSYSNYLKLISVLVAITILVFCFTKRLDFYEVVLIASGLIPFFQFSVKQYFDNRESSERLNRVNEFIGQIWRNIARCCIDKLDLEESSRRIQDEFYENRIKSPLILDSFYWKFRKKNLHLMSKMVDTLVSEIKTFIK